ncbi:MAG: class I SAM-dependent methyltransferase [candidate division Zixibacteria bacterium HGW-Zixibacteria-1]|nr:MAG: class I SAM-dependent methyltransferase [candidate division Zixibacteria bacterium HGW-Zixibacteria-1]
MPIANRLYNDLAWTWHIISKPEDYVEEGENFIDKIKAHSQIDVREILSLGCGGGNLDWVLKCAFKITGVDISDSMLANARKINPENEYLQGDMRTVRLGRLFDAVVIHDAVNYMLTPADLKAAFETAYRHLKQGGVMITYAEVWKENFKQNRIRHQTEVKDNIEITFIENFYDPDPADTTYESTFIYLIRTDGKLQIETDLHNCGVFPLELWPKTLKEIGFEVIETRFDHSEFAEGEDYPMFIGLKK